MKTKTYLAFLVASLTQLDALDFGAMGSTSVGMGGVGVALQNSPFGAYYNPSLISIDSKIRFGYTAGVRSQQRNFDELVNAAKNTNSQNLQTLVNVLVQNHLSLASQNGVSLQISPGDMRGSFGSLAISYFLSAYSSFSAKADSNNQLIVENTSLLLQEIPLTYAYTFFFKNSNLNFGINLKYMNAQRMDMDRSMNINFISKGVSNFGIDLGASYYIDLPKFQGLTFGIVAKNINYPMFKFDGTTVVIKPQYRVGIAYNHPIVTVAFDADILPNEMLTLSNKTQFSQMLATGLKFDLKYVDMRVGVAKDIRQDNGLILSTGVNILGFFDVAFQIGTKSVQDAYMPRYIALQVGGSFSF